MCNKSRCLKRRSYFASSTDTTGTAGSDVLCVLVLVLVVGMIGSTTGSRCNMALTVRDCVPVIGDLIGLSSYRCCVDSELGFLFSVYFSLLWFHWNQN